MEIWETEFPSGVQEQSPGEGLGTKPIYGHKCGCRLYRNTMKNTKHTNTEINKMKTRLGNKFTDDGGMHQCSPSVSRLVMPPSE